MPFETELRECGFQAVYDSYPNPFNSTLTGVFSAVHRDWETILQFWPSDRADAYWVAALVTRRGTLDYRGTPIGQDTIRETLVRFFQTTDVEWWWRPETSRFASHPWITFPGDPEDIGTPGVRQFLSTYPYVRMAAGGIYVQANVRNNPQGIKQFDKTESEIAAASVSLLSMESTPQGKKTEEVSPYHSGKRRINI